MSIHQATTATAFSTPAAEPTFSSVWGNEMQREDFLALAAGLRQFNAFAHDMAFVPDAAGQSVEHAHLAGK